MTDREMIARAIEKEVAIIADKITKGGFWSTWSKPDGYVAGTFMLDLHDLSEDTHHE